MFSDGNPNVLNTDVRMVCTFLRIIIIIRPLALPSKTVYDIIPGTVQFVLQDEHQSKCFALQDYTDALSLAIRFYYMHALYCMISVNNVEARTSHSKQSSLPKGDTVKKRVSSAISLAQDGLFGKACQVLVSPGVAPPNNDETWRLLVDKHPEGACPSVPTLTPVDTAIPPDLNLMAVLRSFPKLTAAGPSGLRIQHIIDASEVPPQMPILQSLRTVINLLAAPPGVSTFLAGGNPKESPRSEV